MMNMLSLNFALMHIHDWSLESIEDMHPWELETYVVFLNKYITDRNNEIRKQAAIRGNLPV